jgi:flagellar protein FliS
LSAYAPAAASPAAYLQQAVLTASPGQLVVMLYDGACRFLTQAAYAMREGDRFRSHQRLGRAEAIIDELLVTLDMEAGDISTQLQAIYVFCRRQLTDARMDDDAERIQWVHDQLADLREAWAEIANR